MESMYNVECLNLRSVSRAVYRFMVNPFLVRPECTIWDNNGATSTVVNCGPTFMTERELFHRIVRTAVASITCVASTDLADTRRVVFAYMPGLDHMMLSFPQSNGILSAVERKIVEDLRSYDGLVS